MNSNEQQSSLQTRFAEVFVHLRDQDIEQFYAQYQLWVMRHRIPILENEIETLRGDIAENQQRIQNLRPSALAQAVLARLQAQGVTDVALLDQLLERGEDWLDRMMQRLDYCEQVGNFIQGDYTQWCINSLEGAYDWIDTARGSEREDAEMPATPEISAAEAQITAELLLSKLRGEEDETPSNAPQGQPAPTATPHITDQFDVESENDVEEGQLASVEGSVELVKSPTYEQALEILGIENACPTDESETSAHTPEPEEKVAALTEQEEEEQSAPWYNTDLEQLEPFDLAHSQGMDDWIKVLQAEPPVSSTAQPVEIDDKLAAQEEHAPITGETSEQRSDESSQKMAEVISPESAPTAAQEAEQTSEPEFVNERMEIKMSSGSAEDSDQIAQTTAEASATGMAEQDVLVPENAPEEELRAEEYGTVLFEPIEEPLPWYEYLVLGEMSENKQALAPEPVEEQPQEAALDETQPFELNKIHPTPQPETSAPSLEQVAALPPDLQDAFAEESAAVIEQAPENPELVAREATEIAQNVHTEEDESSQLDTDTLSINMQNAQGAIENTTTEQPFAATEERDHAEQLSTLAPERSEKQAAGEEQPESGLAAASQDIAEPAQALETSIIAEVEQEEVLESELATDMQEETVSASMSEAQTIVESEATVKVQAVGEPEPTMEAANSLESTLEGQETQTVAEPETRAAAERVPTPETQTIVESEPAPEQPKKRGFWRRLFGWGRKK